MSHPVLPRAPRDKTINQIVHMVLPMVLDAKAAEDGHVGHQRKERILVLERLSAGV